MGSYDGGEDIIYILELDADYSVEFKLDPNGTTYAGIGVFDSCPDADNCISILTWGSSSDVDSMEVVLEAGTYYFMVDTWSLPDCIPVFDLDITAVEITCLPVSNLGVSDAMATQVTFNWSSNVANYDYAVDTTGFDIEAATPTAVTDTFMTATGLDPLTTYDIYVRANCGVDDGLSTWEMISFNTPCAEPVAVMPLIENFDNASIPELPCGWSTENVNGDTYTWETRVGNGGQEMTIRYNSSMIMDDIAKSAKIALVTATDYTVKFELKTSTTYPENLAVTLIDNNGDIVDTLLNFVNHAAAVYEIQSGEFTVASDGDYRIGFHGYSDANQLRISIDNFAVFETSDCPVPLSISASDITETEALITWDSVGTEYHLIWGTTGFDPDADPPVFDGEATVMDTNIYSLTALMAATEYDVYVQQNCTDDSSTWNGVTFTTNDVPPINDTICGAQLVALGDTTVVDNTWATWNADSATCWGNYNNGDVWLKFVFNSTTEFNGVEIVTEAGTSSDSHIALYSSDGDCSGNLTQLGCGEDLGGGNYMSYIIPTVLESGTYYVQGATWTNSEGNYGIAIHPVFVLDPPVNDTCGGAQITAVEVGTMATATGDGTGATASPGFPVAEVWEAFSLTECANVTIDFCGSVPMATTLYINLFNSCPIGASLPTGVVTFIECAGNDSAQSIYFENLAAGTYWYPVLADSVGYNGFTNYTINYNAEACAPTSDTCSTFLGGPWSDFNTIFGGAPVDSAGICPVNEITTFSVWASESYTVDGFVNGVTYTFSMCNGYGAWAAELSIWDENGDLVVFLSDTCSISWTATYDGTYVIGINEVDACGSQSTNASTDNGFPSLTCEGADGINELEQADFAIYPNPNNGEFSIVNEGVNGRYLIELIDVTGKVVYSEQLRLNANEKTVINSTGVNTGVYLVKMTNTEANYYRTLRMVIK
jgi:hypothetical protein